MRPVILDKNRNLAWCLELITVAAGKGASLIVFPEAALTGYVFSSLAEALSLAEPVPGPSLSTTWGANHPLLIFGLKPF